METITIPKKEFEQMQQEIKMLKSTRLYQRLLAFEQNLITKGKFTRKDLGF